MDDGLGHWLRLREPADVHSRAASLVLEIADSLGRHDPVRLLDLGTGTGSNIRYLAERLRGRQQWLAIDRSAELLAALPERFRAWAAPRGFDVVSRSGSCVVRGPHFESEIQTRQQDLGVLGDHRVFDGRHLVAASALLDLVSEQWLRSLAGHCRTAGALALFAITYNGRFSCEPREVEDDTVRDLMNRHQKTDKGLGGVAAGPDAAAVAERCFAEAGYRVRRESSDWVLGPAEHSVQRLLIDGWAGAASEIVPGSAVMVADWRARRLAHVDAGRSSVVVGHDDLAAWPGEATRSGPG